MWMIGGCKIMVVGLEDVNDEVLCFFFHTSLPLPRSMGF